MGLLVLYMFSSVLDIVKKNWRGLGGWGPPREPARKFIAGECPELRLRGGWN